MMMIFKIFFMAIHATDGSSLPFRSTTQSDVDISTTRFPWSHLLPRDILLTHQKHILRTEFPQDSVDELVDRIPVFYRIEILHRLADTRHKKQVKEILRRETNSNPPELSNYVLHLLGNTYVEQELFVIFIRLVLSRPPESYYGRNPYRPRSATRLLQQMREFARNQLNLDLNFLSSRTLVDWADAMQKKLDFRTQVELEEADQFATARVLTPRTFVFLERATCSKIFKKRLYRLSLTGYEDIDL